jgi:hypothetical protein
MMAKKLGQRLPLKEGAMRQRKETQAISEDWQCFNPVAHSGCVLLSLVTVHDKNDE